MATSEPQPFIDQPMASRPSVMLAMLGHHAMEQMRVALSQCGIKPRQMQILEFLAREGAVGQRELGVTLGIDHSILVTMLNPLEDDGLVERRRSCRDRRRHVVTLTDAGRRRYAEAADRVDGAEQQLLARLSAAERAQLTGLLAALSTGELTEPADGC